MTLCVVHTVEKAQIVEDAAALNSTPTAVLVSTVLIVGSALGGGPDSYWDSNLKNGCRG
jgi:hypothetical protein